MYAPSSPATAASYVCRTRDRRPSARGARDEPEHAYRVVSGGPPQRIVESAKDLPRSVLPAPPQVRGELIEAADSCWKRRQARVTTHRTPDRSRPCAFASTDAPVSRKAGVVAVIQAVAEATGTSSDDGHRSHHCAAPPASSSPSCGPPRRTPMLTPIGAAAEVIGCFQLSDDVPQHHAHGICRTGQRRHMNASTRRCARCRRSPWRRRMTTLRNNTMPRRSILSRRTMTNSSPPRPPTAPHKASQPRAPTFLRENRQQRGGRREERGEKSSSIVERMISSRKRSEVLHEWRGDGLPPAGWHHAMARRASSAGRRSRGRMRRR